MSDPAEPPNPDGRTGGRHDRKIHSEGDDVIHHPDNLVIEDNIIVMEDGTVAPVLTPAELADIAYNRLYERAEDASNAGVPLHEALQAIRDGYSSAEVDRDIAENGA